MVYPLVSVSEGGATGGWLVQGMLTDDRLFDAMQQHSTEQRLVPSGTATQQQSLYVSQLYKLC